MILKDTSENMIIGSRRLVKFSNGYQASLVCEDNDAESWELGILDINGKLEREHPLVTAVTKDFVISGLSDKDVAEYLDKIDALPTPLVTL